MTRKLLNKFKTLEKKRRKEGEKVDLLSCWLCQCPIHLGDKVVTKPSRYSGGRKIYHDECYENAHISID